MKTKASESMAILFYMVFKQVFPLWERYDGHVPQFELERLDQKADFPSGLAAIAVARLNRDKSLQKQCERRFRSDLSCRAGGALYEKYT
jgi:hypothetical protein